MKTSARYLRAPIAWAGDTTPPVVDHERKVITGYAVITPGEALGHGMWIDQSFVQDVAQMGNQKAEGIKVRMTHPGLSADGMGKHLGRAKNFRLDDGGVCRADLHFHKKATGPRADMIDDVMSLAEEDPKAFGSSIVFMRDESAEEVFVETHTTADGFVSPDPENAKNLSHARIAQLRASDIVDEPAANPNGFLSDNEEFASRAEVILNYTLRVAEDAPDVLVLGDVPPEKLRLFFDNYMERHGLAIVNDGQMAALLDRVAVAETKAAAALVELQVARDTAAVPLASAIAEAEALQAVTCPQCGCEFEPSDDGEEEDPNETEPDADPDDMPMAAPQREMVEQFGAISYGHAHPDGTPLAPKGEPWDGPPQVTAATVEDLRVMCTWVDSERQELKTAYKLPHHKADGDHACVWRGVAQAASRLPQAFMPESDRPGCRAHLGRHYHEFDEQPPWERNAAGWAVYEQFCTQLHARGGVQDAELAMVLRSLGFTPEADALVTVGPLGGEVPLPEPSPPTDAPPVVPTPDAPAPPDTGNEGLSAEDMQTILAAVEHRMEQKLMTVTGRLPRKLVS